MQSEQINELAAALSKAQGEVENAQKNRENEAFKRETANGKKASKYADLAAVWEACRTALTKNGLSVVQTMRTDEAGTVYVVTTLLHSSGQWLSGEMPARPTKNDMQGLTGAITYARRSSLAAMVGVAQDDDDGNTAVGSNANTNAVSNEPITQEQVADLSDLLDRTGSNLDAFLKFFAVDLLKDLPARRYSEAVQMLERKRKQGQHKEAA